MTGSLPTAGSPDSDSDAGIAGAVTGEWVEVYPPDGESPELQPEPRRPRTGVLPTLLFAVSVVLVLFGSLGPLFYAFMGTFSDGRNTMVAGAWRVTSIDVVDGQPLTTTAPMPVPVGYPIALAGVLLLVAVTLRLRAARGARTAGAVAATCLVTTVLMLGMLEIAWPDVWGEGGPGPGAVQAGVGAGFWSLLAAAVVASLAAVLSFRASPRPESEPEPVAATWPAEPVAARPEAPDGQPAEWPVVAVIPVDEGTNW